MAHADRRRVIADEYRARLVRPNLRVQPTYLLDGFVAGLWSMRQSGGKRGPATLSLQPFLPTATSRDETVSALRAEAEGLLRFVYPDAAEYTVELA